MFTVFDPASILVPFNAMLRVDFRRKILNYDKDRLPDQSIRVASAKSQHLVFKWNFWCFDLSMRLLVMTSHGSVSIASFDRLKMFPHPVTVKASAFTDVGLGALSTCQLVAEVLPHAINTFTQIAFPVCCFVFLSSNTLSVVVKWVKCSSGAYLIN